MTSSGSPIKLAVVESTWWNHSSASVRPLLDTVCQIVDWNSYSFHYETANSKLSLTDAIARTIQMTHVKYLYLAVHGSRQSLDCFNGDKVTLANLTSILRTTLAKVGTALDGVHLSSCGFGHHRNLKKILTETPKIEWVSGYSTDVDWLPSAALDMMFVYNLLKSDKTTPKAVIADAALTLRRQAPGACKDLGLNILVRKGSATLNLMDET